jgi:hypothetical protein
LNTASSEPGSLPGKKRRDWGQVIKWTVYILLLLNFGYYFFEELYISSHTLRQGGTLMQWAEEFATSIDELGWFGLLFMFELETYALSDRTLNRKSVTWTIHGVRLLCYIMLAHTVLARVTTVNGFLDVERAPGISSLCEVADQDISFGVNYRYTIIDSTNCAQLSQDNTFYFLEPSVITDSGGHALEKKHVLVDLSDAVTWLLVVWAIELAVWLQNRNITGGGLMLATHAAKVFYGVLFVHAGFWAWTGHWVYAWDQTLWIVGFWAIEKNLSDWRDEIREEDTAAVSGHGTVG